MIGDTPTYICIDLKSYYASVECVYRGLDPLKANLLVADESRSDQTICLAVSPSLKAKGVPGRPRLFEAKQAIRLWENQHHEKISFLIHISLHQTVHHGSYPFHYHRWLHNCLWEHMGNQYVPGKPRH